MVRILWIVTVVAAAVLLSSFGCGQDAGEAPSGSTDHRTVRTGSEERTSSSGPGERTVGMSGFVNPAPKKNPNPIPNVVGMRVETACRILLQKQFLAYIWGKKHSDEFGPGRVVAQKPEAGIKPGVPHGVFLYVSKPFPDVLPQDTHCAERTVGPID